MSRPAIIVATSHVVRGGVGGRAAVFALERMGFPVWSLPTVVLAWHPGQGKATRILPPSDEFAASVTELAGSPKLGEVGAVLTGYIGEQGQVGPLERLVEALKRVNPNALYLCDPVIGDAGGLFRPPALAGALRQQLLPLADIATPNRHELGWLADSEAADNARLIDAARKLGPREVAVTSAFATEGEIGAMLVAGAEAHLATHRRINNAPRGTGDLFAALYLGCRLEGLASTAALTRSAGAVLRLVERAAELEVDELPLADAQDALVAPPPDGIALTSVAAARGRRPI